MDHDHHRIDHDRRLARCDVPDQSGPKIRWSRFIGRTHPSAAGWRPIAALAPDVRPSTGGLFNLMDWICGCVLIYGILFGTGKLLLEEFVSGSLLLAAGLIAGAIIYWDLSRRGWSSVVD